MFMTSYSTSFNPINRASESFSGSLASFRRALILSSTISGNPDLIVFSAMNLTRTNPAMTNQYNYSTHNQSEWLFPFITLYIHLDLPMLEALYKKAWRLGIHIYYTLSTLINQPYSILKPPNFQFRGKCLCRRNARSHNRRNQPGWIWTVNFNTWRRYNASAWRSSCIRRIGNERKICCLYHRRITGSYWGCQWWRYGAYRWEKSPVPKALLLVAQIRNNPCFWRWFFR